MSQSLVFISYSHLNEELKDKLLSHLGVLKVAGIDTWSDNRIRGGADWQSEIAKTIADARVAVLLVTADFLNSDFILREEVPALLKRRKQEGLIVFPVIAKHCAWTEVPWLTRMSVRPPNGKPVWSPGEDPDEKLATIAVEIADIIKTATALPNASPAEAPAAIRLDLDTWTYLAELKTKFLDRILLEQGFAAEDKLFQSLDELIRGSLERGLSVDTHSSRTRSVEKISKAEVFWVSLITQSVLSENAGSLKWLISETTKALREGRVSPPSVIARVWAHLSNRYCDHSSVDHRPEVLSRIVDLVIAAAGRNHDSLYRLVNFLYSNLETDALSIRTIAERLKTFDRQLGDQATRLCR